MGSFLFMKKPPLRKQKKKSPTWWRKKCVFIAKLIARHRDGDVCQYCGRTSRQVQIHGSHILPEGTYVSMSADPDNIIPLCAEHHIAGMSRFIGRSREPSWHGDPLHFAQWFEKKWPGREKKLRDRAKSLQIAPNWGKRYQELKEEYKSLINNCSVK